MSIQRPKVFSNQNSKQVNYAWQTKINCNYTSAYPSDQVNVRGKRMRQHLDGNQLKFQG